MSFLVSSEYWYHLPPLGRPMWDQDPQPTRGHRNIEDPRPSYSTWPHFGCRESGTQCTRIFGHRDPNDVITMSSKKIQSVALTLDSNACLPSDSCLIPNGTSSELIVGSSCIMYSSILMQDGPMKEANLDSIRHIGIPSPRTLRTRVCINHAHFYNILLTLGTKVPSLMLLPLSLHL